MIIVRLIIPLFPRYIFRHWCFKHWLGWKQDDAESLRVPCAIWTVLEWAAKQGARVATIVFREKLIEALEADGANVSVKDCANGWIKLVSE